jgi:hypothetical protein
MDWEFIMGILPITILWRISNNELSRWMRARNSGMQGESVIFGIAVDIIGGISSFSYYPWLVIAAFNFGFPEIIATAIITFAFGMILNFFMIGDSIFKWLAGLIISPIMMVVAYSHLF